MFSSAAWLIDFLGMALALWLAAYLLSRGLRSALTRSAGLIFLLLAAAFLISLYDLRVLSAIQYRWLATVQTLALLAWYRLTFLFLTPTMRWRVQWMALTIYGLGVLKIVILAAGSVRDAPSPVSSFNLVPYNQAFFEFADVVFLLIAAAGTLINFRLGSRAGIGPHSQPLWVASLFGALAIAYGTAAVVVRPTLPRVIQSALLVVALALCGYAVARYQAFVERRTTLRDLPVSGLTMFGLAALYGWLGLREGLSPFQVAVVVALVIVTHAAYDVVRDLLDNLIHRRESGFRRQLRTLARDAGGEADLPAHLAPALETLVHLVGATGGFMAVRREAGYLVMASVASVPVGTVIDASEVPQQELGPPGPALATRIAWLAPAFAGDEVVAVLALAPRFNRGAYSEADLDLLADLADWAGRVVASERRQSARRAELLSLASAVQTGEEELQAQAQNLITTLEAQPDLAFARQVEQALQHLSDFAFLGQSELVTALQIPVATHIERGKALRQRLVAAIDSLRPSAARPGGVLPREWRAFAILHDAYVEDVPNREIMARLYIGEGNFNRSRRQALAAVARALYETRLAAPREPQPTP